MLPPLLAAVPPPRRYACQNRLQTKNLNLVKGKYSTTIGIVEALVG